MTAPIDSYARFFDALASSLAYAESSEFHYPALQPGLVSELRAIRAWTAHGRTPRVAERASPSFAWALMRTRDGGPDEPPEHASRLELARRVVVFFCNWPRDDEDAQREREALVTVPRVPTRDELAVVADRIEREVNAVSGAAIWPLAPAFQSREPLMRDTMTIPQWVRWVLLPRLRDMVAGVTKPPTQSQLCTLARDLAKDEETWPLLYALGELDDLFVTSLADALAKRRN
jgi:uncharacterized protein YqcC (DUF446 family)